VKDVLFEPVRKTQDAMFFFRSDGGGGTWTPCGSRQPGAVQTTMEELAEEGMADKVNSSSIFFSLLLSSVLAQIRCFPVVMYIIAFFFCLSFSFC
jgi:hypothetical protein